jgi:type I restriction enzyme S subunit
MGKKKTEVLLLPESGEMIKSDNINSTDQYPVFGGNGIRGYTSKFTNNGRNILIGRQGALCGNINLAEGKFWASEHAIIVTIIDQSECDYFKYLLQVMNLNQYSVSAAQPGLSVEKISNLEIICPSNSEQTSIAAFLDEKTQLIDETIAAKERLLELYEEEKKAIINQAVTKGLDPNVPMKDSGIEWLGEIPEHWEVVKFYYLSYMKGRIGWQGLKQAEFSDKKELPFLITGMNFKDGKIRWNEVYHITEERYEEAPEIQLQEGDVLMTKDGTIGKLLFVDDIPYPGKASLNSHLLLLRPLDNSYHPRYLYHQLSTDYFDQFVELYKTGTTFYGITQDAMGKYKMILPPIEEQESIALKVDELTSSFEKEIKTVRTEIDLLKEYRQSLIYEAVTGKIDVREYVSKPVETS